MCTRDEDTLWNGASRTVVGPVVQCEVEGQVTASATPICSRRRANRGGRFRPQPRSSVLRSAFAGPVSVSQVPCASSSSSSFAVGPAIGLRGDLSPTVTLGLDFSWIAVFEGDVSGSLGSATLEGIGYLLHWRR